MYSTKLLIGNSIRKPTKSLCIALILQIDVFGKRPDDVQINKTNDIASIEWLAIAMRARASFESVRKPVVFTARIADGVEVLQTFAANVSASLMRAGKGTWQSDAGRRETFHVRFIETLRHCFNEAGMATLADDIVCRRLPDQAEMIAARDSLFGINVSSITTAMAALEGVHAEFLAIWMADWIPAMRAN